MQSYTTILKERLNFKIEYDTQLNFNFEIIEPGDIKLKLKFWKKNDKIKSIFTSPLLNDQLKFIYELKKDHLIIGFIPTKIGYHLIKINNPDIVCFKILVITKSIYKISSNLMLNLTSNYKFKKDEFNDKLINKSDNDRKFNDKLINKLDNDKQFNDKLINKSDNDKHFSDKLINKSDDKQFSLKLDKIYSINRLDNTIFSGNSKRKIKISNYFNDKLNKQKEKSFNNLNIINDSNLINHNNLSNNQFNSNNLSNNLFNSMNSNSSYKSTSSIDSINSIHYSTSSTESIQSFNTKFLDHNKILNSSNTSSLDYKIFINSSKFNSSSIDYNKILNRSKSNTNSLDDKQVYIYELNGDGDDEFKKIKQSTYEQLVEDVRNEENNLLIERSFNQSNNKNSIDKILNYQDNKFNYRNDYNDQYFFNSIGQLNDKTNHQFMFRKKNSIKNSKSDLKSSKDQLIHQLAKSPNHSNTSLNRKLDKRNSSIRLNNLKNKSTLEPLLDGLDHRRKSIENLFFELYTNGDRLSDTKINDVINKKSTNESDIKKLNLNNSIYLNSLIDNVDLSKSEINLLNLETSIDEIKLSITNLNQQNLDEGIKEDVVDGCRDKINSRKKIFTRVNSIEKQNKLNNEIDELRKNLLQRNLDQYKLMKITKEKNRLDKNTNFKRRVTPLYGDLNDINQDQIGNDNQVDEIFLILKEDEIKSNQKSNEIHKSKNQSSCESNETIKSISKSSTQQIPLIKEDKVIEDNFQPVQKLVQHWANTNIDNNSEIRLSVDTNNLPIRTNSIKSKRAIFEQMLTDQNKENSIKSNIKVPNNDDKLINLKNDNQLKNNSSFKLKQQFKDLSKEFNRISSFKQDNSTHLNASIIPKESSDNNISNQTNLPIVNRTTKNLIKPVPQTRYSLRNSVNKTNQSKESLPKKQIETNSTINPVEDLLDKPNFSIKSNPPKQFIRTSPPPNNSISPQKKSRNVIFDSSSKLNQPIVKSGLLKNVALNSLNEQNKDMNDNKINEKIIKQNNEFNKSPSKEYQRINVKQRKNFWESLCNNQC